MADALIDAFVVLSTIISTRKRDIAIEDLRRIYEDDIPDAWCPLMAILPASEEAIVAVKRCIMETLSNRFPDGIPFEWLSHYDDETHDIRGTLRSHAYNFPKVGDYMIIGDRRYRVTEAGFFTFNAEADD